MKGGQTVRQFAAAQAVDGFTVWRSYDEPGGIRDQLVAAARNYPAVTKLVKLGTTYQGRDILALKVTQGARGQKDGSRPAVIFSATQHAREWIATEMMRRLMNTYLQRWYDNDKTTKKLLQSTELWFMPMMNPDGYEYTFTDQRLWRKNLRDNNGDGITQVGDGVDPNRNYPSHWGYDNEGSSDIPSSETYRGPSPASEPETLAGMKLFDLAKAEFMVNYHSNGRWLLYNDGWQIGTPTADDPIYYALSGNLDQPAIKDFHPGLSSDVLYVTNGEVDGYAQEATGTLAWTPELSPGCPGCGFVFPDDEALVQEEFERNLPFAESVADSAADPDDPKSSLGITTKPFYLDSEDPYKSGLPACSLSFTESYGDPQPVAVLAKRSLGDVTAKWRINGGRDTVRAHPRVDRRREVRHDLDPLPPGARRRHRHRSRRHRGGVVRGRRPTTMAGTTGTRQERSRRPQPVVHLSRRLRDRQPGPGRVGRGLHRCLAGPGPRRSALPRLLPRRARGQRPGRRRLRRGRQRPHGARRPRRPEPLRRRDLVHRRRRRHPHRRTRRRQRGPARARRDAGVPRVHERGRQGDVHRQPGGRAVHRQRRHPAVRPAGHDRLQPASRRHRPAPLPGAAGSGDGTNDVLQYWFGGYLAVPGRRHRRRGRRLRRRPGSTTRSPGPTGR